MNQTSGGLPLQEIRLAATAGGGLARTVVRQRYTNPSDEVIEVVYKTPLPSDGAVAGYAFDVAGRRIEGQVRRRKDARQLYEEALYEGRTASLVDEERDDLFTLRLGAVPPGAEIVAELTVDHPLAWRLGEGWQWRFPTAAVPRYLGRPGRVKDGDKLEIPVSEEATGVTVEAFVEITDDRADGGPRRVELPVGPPDRDLVVDWSPASDEGVRIECIRREGDEHAHALLTVVPPAPESAKALPRDLIVLLDTSGSMSGEPLGQAKAVVAALIDGLGADDKLELMAFAMDVEIWDPEGDQDAHEWLRTREARGGTEMRRAVSEALRPMRDSAQRQVVLVTDGHIGFEQEVVGSIVRDLPSRSQLHVVGVGAAMNRTLTRNASRAGRGREILLAVGQDPERAARALDAATRAPVLTNLEVAGDALLDSAPRRPTDVLLGEPCRLYLRLDPVGGPLRLTGRTAEGPWQMDMQAPPASPVAVQGPRAAVASAYGRERVADLELERVASKVSRPKRKAGWVDEVIEALGLELNLSTRLTSWVAVDDQPGSEPGGDIRLVDMPHDLAYGLSAEGLGLRSVQESVSVACMRFPSDSPEWMPERRESLSARAVRSRAAAPDDLPAEFETAARRLLNRRRPRRMSRARLRLRDGRLALIVEPFAPLSVGGIVALELSDGRLRRVKVVGRIGDAWFLDGPAELRDAACAVHIADHRIELDA